MGAQRLGPWSLGSGVASRRVRPGDQKTVRHDSRLQKEEHFQEESE